MDPKSRTDFPRPDRATAAEGAPPYERASSSGERTHDDRAYGFSQHSGYPASGGAKAPELPPKEGAEARRGEILAMGPHDLQPEGSVPDLNTAPADEIAKADFVGSAVAEAIVALREKLGSFGSWEDLWQIEGMKANQIAELQRTFRLAPTP